MARTAVQSAVGHDECLCGVGTEHIAGSTVELLLGTYLTRIKGSQPPAGCCGDENSVRSPGCLERVGVTVEEPILGPLHRVPKERQSLRSTLASCTQI